jgi:hypothetical protein
MGVTARVSKCIPLLHTKYAGRRNLSEKLGFTKIRKWDSRFLPEQEQTNDSMWKGNDLVENGNGSGPRPLLPPASKKRITTVMIVTNDTKPMTP